MAVLLSPNAKQQFLTDSGAIASGYKLYTYAAGTTTPQATYTNRAGTVANANPITLDARGEATVYLTPGLVYDYVLKSAADVTIWTREDVIADAGDADAVSFTQAGTGAVARTVQDKLRDGVSVKDFGAVGDGVADDSAAFAALVAYVNSRASNRGTVVYVPDGTYLVTVAPGTFNRPCSIIGEGAANCALHFQDCDGLRWDLSAETSFNFTSTVRGVGLYTSGTTHTGLYFKGKQTFAPHGPVLLLDAVHFDSYGYLTAQASGGKEWAVAIDLDNVDEVAIRDCYIKGQNTDGTWAGVTNNIGIRGTTCTGVRIIHTQIFCVGTGISIIGQSEGWLHHGLTMVAVKYGVIQSATVEPANNHTITGSHISCFMRAVQFDEAVGSLAHVVANNFILGNGNSSADYIGVNLGASSRSQVSNNVIYSNSAGIASDVGIKVGSAAGGGYHTVANNFFRHQSTCIKIDAAVTVENVVTGNSKEVAGNVLLSDASGKAVGVNSEGAKRSNNYGTAIIASGATAVTVNHGLSGAADNIQVTPKGSVASGKSFWIVNDGATSFQIAVDPAPASDLSVFWVAERNTRI